MRVHGLIISLILATAVSSANADSIFYSFERAMATGDAQDALDPEVKLFFGDKPTPPLAEKSMPAVQSRSGVSMMPFGRDSDVLCTEGFAANLTAFINNAKKMGFDTVFNIRGKVGNGRKFSTTGFDCGAGRRTSEVKLVAEYGLTQAGAQLAAQLEQYPAYQASLKKRKPPSKKAIFLPLADVMSSPEVKAVLGPIKAHWGTDKVPVYTERYGPDDYDGEGNVIDLGPEGACRKAVAEALLSVLDDVKEQGYDSIIKIRSYLDKQFAPTDGDLECEVGSKWASVRLLATLANTK